MELPLRAPPGSVVTTTDEGAALCAQPGRHLEGALAELTDPPDSEPVDATGPGAPTAPHEAPAPAPLSQVLVVEDNPSMRRFIADALATEHRVRAVADGEQALAAARREPPDLVVTDLMMPRLGGDQLVEALRADPALHSVPVLVLSAKDDQALRTRLLDARVQDYVTKPFSAQELRARVRNLTTMKRARDALQRELASHSADLTQLTHALIDSRRALQASEQRWQAMFQHSPVGVVLADAQGRILSANPALQAMLGYTEDELRRITLMRITPVEDRAAAQARLDKVLSGEWREVHVQRCFQHSQGALVWANTSVACVPQGQGDGGTEPPFIIVVAEDVTERRRAEEALARARNELARVTRASTLGELAASIAHEVNQPLAAIVANGHACERWMGQHSANGEHEARAAVQRIIRDANRAGEVVARVRRLLRQGELQREPIRIDQVVDEVLDLVRMEAQTSRIALLYEPPRGLPPVQADRVQAQQILLNLLMNAMEAILARASGARWVEVTLATTAEGPDGSNAVRVDVRDSGIGLAPQDLDRVFDAFHTTKPGGMGMGLAISRSIAEAHGGRLWATPGASGEPGAATCGATFSFTLPCEAP